MADMIVSGAGTDYWNGTYIETGTYGGKPRYQMPYDNIRGYLFIAWAYGSWCLSGAGLDSDAPFIVLSVAAGAGYTAPGDVATPDLAVFNQGGGATPYPTVTAAPSSQNLTLT